MSEPTIEPLHEDASLPEELRGALAAYRRIEPDVRMREALLASVEREARPGPALLRVFVGLAVVGAVLALWPLTRPTSVPPPAVAPSIEPASTPVISEIEPEVPPEVAPEQPLASEPVRAPKPRRPRVSPSADAPATAAVPDLAGELALLARAKRSLARDPAQALALTVEHADRFPRGALTEEREVIAIEALARSDRREAAEQRAAQFRAAYPRSTHLARLEVVLAGP